MDAGREPGQADGEPLEEDREHGAQDPEDQRGHHYQPLRAVEHGRRHVQTHREPGGTHEKPEQAPAQQEDGEPDERASPTNWP